MARHRILLALALVLLGAALYLVVDHYQSGRRVVRAQFDTLQLLVARQAVHETVSVLQACSQDLQALASLPSVRSLDRARMPGEIRAYYSNGGHPRPVAISVVDAQGALLCSTDARAAPVDYSGSDLIAWAAHGGNRGEVYVSSATRMPGEEAGLVPRSHFELATPLFRLDSLPGGSPSPAAWCGVLVATVDLESILAEHVAVLAPGSPAHRVWIMDEEGTILLQSEHPEMIRENINRTGPACAQCHESFDYAKSMLGAGPGVTEYQLKDQPMKLAAFAPLRFANASWVVVVNAPYTEVTAFARREFAKTLMLLGIIAAMTGVASAIVHRLNVSRVRAEEAAKQAQEKIQLAAELQHRNEELQTALVNIKTLTGLLPICAGCKKIRDDRGYWQQVESYIETRSDARFSHALCPECCHKFYPDVFPDVAAVGEGESGLERKPEA